MNKVKMIIKSKSTIIIIFMIVVNLFLLYRLNLKTSDKAVKNLKVVTSSSNRTPISLDLKKLPSIKPNKKLSLVVYVDEYSCVICNNYILWNLKNISLKFPKNVFLFVSGGEKFIKNINTNYEFTNGVRIEKFNAGHNFNRPIGLLLDSNNKNILELEADFSKLNEIDLFFERIKSLLSAVYDINQNS